MAAGHTRLLRLAGADRSEDAELLGADGALVFAIGGHHRSYGCYRALVRIPAGSPGLTTAAEAAEHGWAAEVDESLVAEVFVLPKHTPVVYRRSSTLQRHGATLTLGLDTERPAHDRTSMWEQPAVLRARAHRDVATIADLDALLDQLRHAPCWPTSPDTAGSRARW
jgi:hypothetical protein